MRSATAPSSTSPLIAAVAEYSIAHGFVGSYSGAPVKESVTTV